MAAPGPRKITSLTFVPTSSVNVRFTSSGASAIANSVEYVQAGSGWGNPLVMNVPGSADFAAISIPNSGWGKDWLVRVRGVNADGYGPYSEPEVVYIPGLPTTMVNLKLSLARPINVSFSWSFPLGYSAALAALVTSYEVQYSVNSTFAGSQSLTTKNRSVVITDAAIGRVTYFRVRARNSQGWGPWSTPALLLLDGGPRVRQSGAWKHTIAYVNVSGVWRKAIPFVKQNGVWKPGIG